MKPISILAGLLSLPLLTSAPASAQEEEGEDFPDDVEEADEILKPTERQVAAEGKKLAEVVRGFYTQAMLTDSKFVGMVQVDPNYAPVGDASAWGIGLRVAAGYDVLDAPSFATAVELAYEQGVYNGYGPNVLNVSPIQGDFRTHAVEVAVRPAAVLGKSRRWSAYGRVGGGMFKSEQTVSDAAAPIPGLHGAFMPFGTFGVGLEYYSKLSHFSFTLLETELQYVPGFDAAFGVNFVGLKYTF